MKQPDTWPRLARACLDCRDELRSLIPVLDAAIAAGSVPRRMLVQIRAALARNAERLRVGLKHPETEPRQNSDSARMEAP
jgi:hypothetical protein